MSDQQLASFIDRLRALDDRKDELAEEKRGIYAEAHGEGYDKAALGLVIRKLRACSGTLISA